jgi:hypothetical protein
MYRSCVLMFGKIYALVYTSSKARYPSTGNAEQMALKLRQLASSEESARTPAALSRVLHQLAFVRNTI